MLNFLGKDWQQYEISKYPQRQRRKKKVLKQIAEDVT